MLPVNLTVTEIVNNMADEKISVHYDAESSRAACLPGPLPGDLSGSVDEASGAGAGLSGGEADDRVRPFGDGLGYGL
ncbi:hypothetical protein [Streptomyces sp. Rer75]|uniref:hypothetical protein n=1 Tax=Streptomyces sp. Rer75 TaxID=2750011 RepID=UPI0015CFD193|nr:hypothetical protein HYQ63_05030 [Streptomyces sp. Rer75]